ncbi:probable inactive receptor kinase At5g67200 [Zingiber officinale]|uniref:Protein kinase domain-containing protein n=1 Tax=Zingiber officinale TaxID=94328 RepID=A0A8J5ID47_ZINOF|nr:probable inactive receptor kinase At5g67200 [Zingiber officinale]KAG6532831.1 hypothetical protein ZIOFF_006685 [Zingiber officinale]
MASRRPIAMLDAAVLLLLLSCAAAVAPATGASSDAAALLAFKSAADPGNRLTFPPPPSNDSTAHCLWPGVSCSSSGRVVRVVLVNSGITGFFTSGTLGRLDQLRILSLQENSLAGPIPDLSPLLNLRALFLGHNRFGGSFPPSIVSLRRLRVLDLSRNHLAGPVLPALASLDRLVSIRLDFNRFNGSLPAFNRSSLKSLNVSFNNFSGAIPTTAVLSSFAASSFAGNPGLCGEILKRECGDGAHVLFFHGDNDSHNAPSPTNPSFGQNNGINLPGAAASSPSQKMHKGAVVAIWLLAVSMLAIGILGVLLVTQRRRKRMKRGESLSPVKRNSYGVVGVADPAAAAVESYNKEIESRNNELIAAAAMAVSEEKVKKLAKSGCLVFCAGEAQVYTLEQLMKSSAEMLGRGSLGTTYKAVLENRLIVTVKRLDATKLATTGKEAFERHMQVVGRLRHPNLVPLRAYFHSKEERLLVYDYRPNGSLHSLIHGSRSTSPKPLHWTSCLKIAEDVAQGLAYVHQASRLVHGSIKASNILLGSDFEACLTDNCLSFLIEPSDSEDISGYRVPETQKCNGPFTPKSDIYCFGVLLLELLTGKSPLQFPILSATEVPAWVQSTREDSDDDERLMMIAHIAAACVQPSPDSRPTTWQVLKMIQEVKEADTGNNDNDSASIS